MPNHDSLVKLIDASGFVFGIDCPQEIAETAHEEWKRSQETDTGTEAKVITIYGIGDTKEREETIVSFIPDHVKIFSIANGKN